MTRQDDVVSYTPSPGDSPFHRLGGADVVRAVVEGFYDAMSELEPGLAKLHALDAQGKVARATRDRFALFFIGWLGGPQDYTAQHGHPRLRMRHAHVPIDDAMGNAWMRCMEVGLDRARVEGDARVFVEGKLRELAAFLRNRA